MSFAFHLKNGIRKIIQEDLKTIFVFSIFLISIWGMVPMVMGWYGGSGVEFNTPSINAQERSRSDNPDSDGDLLPDIIENAPRGSAVFDPATGRRIGTGTGTDPFARDTDGDLFTDAAEDNLGTDPNSWISPGWIWIFWTIVILYIVYLKYLSRPNRLREYEEFEELQSSGGVSTESSKFAYGTSSIFSKRGNEMSEEEKQQLVQQDPRYRQMMGETTQEKKAPKLKFNYTRLFIRFFLLAFVTIVFLWVRSI